MLVKDAIERLSELKPDESIIFVYWTKGNVALLHDLDIPDYAWPQIVDLADKIDLGNVDDQLRYCAEQGGARANADEDYDDDDA